MARTVITERGERATAELMFTLAAHARWRRHEKLRSLGRLSRFGTASPISYLTLPHVAAVAEEYARNLLLACSEPLVPQDHPLLRELWSNAEGKAETWPGQELAWKEWHGLPLTPAKEYQDLRGVIEARNAVVHGLGELTKRQTRGNGAGKKVTASLKRIGIRVEGRRIEIDDVAMRRSVDAARDFISWLDTEAQTRGLLPTKS